MALDDKAIIAAVGDVLAEERAQRRALQAKVDDLTNRLRGPRNLPPELAIEVARAARLLHEMPSLQDQTIPKVVRIERDDDGNLVPVYDH